MKDTLHSLYARGGHYLTFREEGDVPNPTRKAPAELSDAVDTVLGITAWLGTAAGVAGIMITGVMMAVSMKRGEGSEHMSRLGMVLGGCILVSTAGPVVKFFFAAQ
ncbi:MULTISPECIES: hypothetical protein [Streptomyces]|jgi:hypothetical protein|uniref:Conjugal transfer protein TrbC n=1 Tax=Streptomyces ortus TaxID=2867268 RepID=A0ABT3UZM3_9ACTN|nr:MULTISPECIES: hypothetical protein [Streptomyces]MCX4233227.1 hypothetical protein [Streptomyces ortus]